MIFMLSLFEPFYPMEPKTYPRPFDDKNYGFQIKWDGTRILAHIKHGKCELFNRKKNARSKQYPEICDALSGMFSKNEIILDGEIINLKDGKPNFQQLMRRDRASDKMTIEYLMRLIPVTYIVFDIILLDDRILVDHPFQGRDHLLKSTINPCDPVVVTDTFIEKGTSLYSLIIEKGLEGMVAKKLDSLYEIGKKSGSWLKVKNRRQISCSIGGFLADDTQIKSLLLGIKENNELFYIGNAATGMTNEQAKTLFNCLCTLVTDSCPFINPPKQHKTNTLRWVQPVYGVRVEYTDFTDEGLLRHPVIKKIMPFDKIK